MFVGHALLAFAIGALAARATGHSPERALWIGLLAGAFGLAPDVDILYAPTGVVGAATLMGAAEGFWSAGNVVHRTVTHSLVVGVATAGSIGALARGTAGARTAGLVVLATLLVVTGAVSGALGLVVLAAFLVAAGAIAAGGRLVGLSPHVIAGTALVGLLTHPFGDLLTGEPPALLYPLDLPLLATRLRPFADPTLNLLAPFALELATAWLAVYAYLRVTDGRVGTRLRSAVSARATIGAAVGVGAVALPAPTLETSYHFVFPAVAVGLVGAYPVRLRGRPCQVAVTGLATVTLAGLTYAVTYLTIGA